MSVTMDQLILDLDKYYEMGNMMSALTVIANFIFQERNNRISRIRRELPLFLEGIEENREGIKRVLKKWKKDSPFKIAEFVDVLERLEEMQDGERQELSGRLQEVAQDVVGERALAFDHYLHPQTFFWFSSWVLFSISAPPGSMNPGITRPKEGPCVVLQKYSSLPY